MRLCFALVLGLTAACAGVSHRQIDPDRDDNARGIRYYGTSLYLLVYSDGKGGIVWQILELPDRTKLMNAYATQSLASVSSELRFRNGTIYGTKDTADSTAVPRAVLESAAKVATGLAKAMARSAPAGPGEDPKPYEVPPVRLYKIHAGKNGVTFRGGGGGPPIRVTLARGELENGGEE